MFSGSVALKVASDPLWFSSTTSALSLAVTPLAAESEMSAGSSTSSTVTVTLIVASTVVSELP